LAEEGYLNITKDTLELRFQVRASTYFQKCRDQQWYINQLLRQQAQNLSQIRDLKDRLDREQRKSKSSPQSNNSDANAANNDSKVLESHSYDKFVSNKQKLMLQEVTEFSDISGSTREQADEKHRHRLSIKTCNNRNAGSNQKTSLPKASTATTSLSISFSSPNLTKNSSFSSSSDSSEFEGACGVSDDGKTLELLKHIEDLDELEAINLVGENDVEYAELTQRMTPPSHKTKQSSSIEKDDSQSSTGEAHCLSANSSSSLGSSSSFQKALAKSDNPQKSGVSLELPSFESYASGLDIYTSQEAHSLPDEANYSLAGLQVSTKHFFCIMIFYYLYFIFILFFRGVC
jgi:hypothetical protein